MRRQRERHAPVTADGQLADRPTPGDITDDQAARYQRLRQGAEALRQLKPQEIRALLFKAEGCSYAEICRLTGWSYTKVNRCLTEGRRALASKVAGIEGGIECARLAPFLDAVARGRAKDRKVALLWLHLRTSLSCRAQLRRLRGSRRAARARARTPGPPRCGLRKEAGR